MGGWISYLSAPESLPAPNPNPNPAPVVRTDRIRYGYQGREVRIVARLLQDLENIDIIVNPTDKSLNLTYGGELSKIILRLAGPEIQQELRKEYPNGIQPGKIAVSKGHNLPYSYVYHCSLQNISQRISHHEIREVVTECLRTAVDRFQPRRPTIAFPAIGTGGMEFHPRVLKTIYCTILEFMIENPNTVKLAYLMIHPQKQELIDYANTINPNVERERLTYPVRIPSSWSESANIPRIRLSQYETEYSSTVSHFRKTIGTTVDIIKVERIENKRLYVAFERYKNLPSNQHTPKHLWHGTSHGSVDGIIRYGFDWRLTERGAYGQGCYFAEKANYSNQDDYSVPNKNGEKCMILAYVLVGNYIVGDSSVTVGNLPSNVQTTVNVLHNPTIFVTYDDDQVYPAFLVVYKKR